MIWQYIRLFLTLSIKYSNALFQWNMKMKHLTLAKAQALAKVKNFIFMLHWKNAWFIWCKLWENKNNKLLNSICEFSHLPIQTTQFWHGVTENIDNNIHCGLNSTNTFKTSPQSRVLRKDLRDSNQKLSSPKKLSKKKLKLSSKETLVQGLEWK